MPRANPVHAAVLVPFVKRGEQTNIVVVRRGARGVHGRQLAFPGGKRDLVDRSLLETALRESREEIGLHPNEVEILEELPALETFTTGFLIHPFLALVRPSGDWRPSQGEIEEVIELGLDELLDPDSHGRELMTFETWPEPQERPFIMVGPHKVWGATYRILTPILERIESGSLSF